MTKRFYLATRKDRASEADALLEALNSYGWQRTFTWADQKEGTDTHASLAVAELAGVREADVLIVLLSGGFGTHVEIGAALAWGKPVILHSPDRKMLETPYPCVFHYHPGVTILISDTVDNNSIIGCLPSDL